MGYKRQESAPELAFRCSVFGVSQAGPVSSSLLFALQARQSDHVQRNCLLVCIDLLRFLFQREAFATPMLCHCCFASLTKMPWRPDAQDWPDHCAQSTPGPPIKNRQSRDACVYSGVATRCGHIPGGRSLSVLVSTITARSSR